MTPTFRHLLGIEPLHPQQISEILDLADHYATVNRSNSKKSDVLELERLTVA